MITVILVIIGLSFLVLIHEAGHFFVAKFFKLKVEEFGFGLPPRLWGLERGETVYSLNWLPFGGFVKILGEERSEGEKGSSPETEARSFYYQKAWKRLLIIIAGVTMNFLVGWFLISAIFMIGTPPGVIVSEIALESPAEAAGIMPGDRVLGFVKSGDFVEYIDAQKGKEIILKIGRGREEVEIKVVPRLNPPENQGPLGVALVDGGAKLGFTGAVKEGLFTALYMVGAIFSALGAIFVGFFSGGPDIQGVVGPVGIFKIAAQATNMGIIYFLQILAVISIHLAVINIMPFPALDGGRFLFILIEKIKGSPLPFKFERLANAIGFSILILLILAMTARDIFMIFNS